MIQSIIVTGAGGFLGREVIRHLLNSTNVPIIAVSSQKANLLMRGWSVPGSSATSRIRVVTNQELLNHDDLLDKSSALINCAFPRDSDGYQMAKGLEFFSKLFERSESSELATLINVSSQSVYDPNRNYAATEASQPVLKTQYAVAKYAVELLAQAHFKTTSFMNLRLSSLIGPSFEQRVINKFAHQILDGGDLSVRGGDQIFDFMAVQDAATAIAKITQIGVVSNISTLNVGAENPLRLHEIATRTANALESHVERKIKVDILPADIPNISSALDCTLLKTHYSFEPRTSLEQSIDAITQYISKEFRNK